MSAVTDTQGAFSNNSTIFIFSDWAICGMTLLLSVERAIG